MQLHTAILPGGIRLVHHMIPGPVAHFGLFIHAGSRDETPGEHGIAHFIEHTVFKGTQKRSCLQVLNRLENVGADLNAFTTKEETCLHASFLREYYGRTLELFHDIFYHSTFPESELEKEKQVVAEEIRSVRDMPDEQIFDDFEDLLFAGHPLGRSILGTEKSVRRLKRDDVLSFIRRNYRPGETVLVSVGNIPFAALHRMAVKYFGSFSDDTSKPARSGFEGFHTFHTVRKKPTAQVHSITGTTAYSFGNKNRIGLAVLTNLLGGPVMSSRLALALRERNGLTYHSEANYTAYSDTGIFTIYFSADRNRSDLAHEIVRKELRRLRDEPLSSFQLAVIKKQILGQLVLGRESNLSLMLAIGKSFLLQDRFDPMEVIAGHIQGLTAHALVEIARETFDEDRLSRLVFQS